ncbi:General transcription and DNA repair factor IIH subunit ssl1 [Astathelohania contejeani]|uniref:General transcription and DNA repair factor IIH subunit ssl1 n=1 Tax=Astathelohania contejeani TaxID=164912 RepID=A0ABQ7I2X5_9MICR|nr:General transcription and DNA repair factor IIH subunit ssl1 [Thelohania contejeani]
MSEQFSWEKKYKRSWEDNIDFQKQIESQYHMNYQYQPYKKAIIRHLHILVDLSIPIDSRDFNPSLRIQTHDRLAEFIENFREENPISQLTFMTQRNGICESHLTSDAFLSSISSKPGSGSFNLYNALDGSVKILQHTKHIREILILTASLNTHDNSMPVLNNIKVHFINFCGEVSLFKKVSENTHGRYFVTLDGPHLGVLLSGFTRPDIIHISTISLLKLGFPQILKEESVCACHLALTQQGYECPVCHTKVCNLPINCPICDTSLVSSVNIMKSQYYLHQLEPFVDAKDSNDDCRICKLKKCEKRCSKCQSLFCKECSDFMHENINFCFYC